MKTRILFLTILFLLMVPILALGNPFKQLNTKQLLALVTYVESLENSSIEGRIAVASVVLERNDYYRWGIKKIILQPRWFSPFNFEDRGFQRTKNIALNFNYYLKKRPGLQESYIIAGMLLNGTMARHKVIASQNVQHFATLNCTNRWIKKMTVVVVLDGHKFMSEGRVIKNDYVAQGKIEFPKSKTVNYIYWMEETIRPFVSLA